MTTTRLEKHVIPLRDGERIGLRQHPTESYFQGWRRHRIDTRSDGKVWTTTTATGLTVSDVLCALFMRDYPDRRVLQVHDYIRSTDWGADL